jgi:hypothetical protein
MWSCASVRFKLGIVNSSRIEEPFSRTVRRNLVIAVCVATGISVLRRDFSSFLPVLALALWPSLGGHYVEVAFVNHIRLHLPTASWAQMTVRLLVWFAGGVLLYLCMMVTTMLLSIRELPIRLWWCGGLLFIALELVVHAVLAIRGSTA